MHQDTISRITGFGLLILTAVALFADFVNAAGKHNIPGISNSTILDITPDGYKLAKHIPWRIENGGFFRIAAFTDSNRSNPDKPIMLLLLGWKGKWVVQNKVTLHYNSENQKNFDYPNYFTDINRIQADSHSLILVRTTVNWGGSGSGQYFDFYDVRDDKLVSLKSFCHGYMEQYYFALYEGAIYNAELVNKRGERRKKSYVYTCYLDVKKYRYDGKQIAEIDSQRYCEKQGPWFLCDSYRFMNIGRALEKGEIFNKKK